jgi:hypothetical protein
MRFMLWWWREGPTMPEGRRQLLHALMTAPGRAFRGPARLPAASPPRSPDITADAVPIEGDAMVFDVVSANVGTGLPEGMALLTVIPVWDQRQMAGFRMRGVCCCGHAKEFSETRGRPDLDLGSLVSDRGELPADVLGFMRIWSRPMTDVIRWLDGCRTRHGDRFQLVIWDDTGYRIPWELLWLETDPHSDRVEGWLGGLVTVTRWLSIRSAWPEVIRDYRTAHICAGPVAAYIDAQMAHDRSLLNGYRVEASNSMYELTEALSRDDSALALIYIACHGTSSDQLSECKLDSLSLMHVDPMHFRRLSSAAAVVFINACHSGSVSYDAGRFNDRVLRGFSEVFLRSGAAGVLATSGGVSDRLASAMASDLFRHLREYPDRSVAEAVRHLRAGAARLTPTDLASVMGTEANRELLPLLYRFMYIYYGSPRTLLSINPGER